MATRFIQLRAQDKSVTLGIRPITYVIGKGGGLSHEDTNSGRTFPRQGSCYLFKEGEAKLFDRIIWPTHETHRLNVQVHFSKFAPSIVEKTEIITDFFIEGKVDYSQREDFTIPPALEEAINAVIEDHSFPLSSLSSETKVLAFAKSKLTFGDFAKPFDPFNL